MRFSLHTVIEWRQHSHFLSTISHPGAIFTVSWQFCLVWKCGWKRADDDGKSELNNRISMRSDFCKFCQMENKWANNQHRCTEQKKRLESCSSVTFLAPSRREFKARAFIVMEMLSLLYRSEICVNILRLNFYEGFRTPIKTNFLLLRRRCDMLQTHPSIFLSR